MKGNVSSDMGSDIACKRQCGMFAYTFQVSPCKRCA